MRGYAFARAKDSLLEGLATDLERGRGRAWSRDLPSRSRAVLRRILSRAGRGVGARALCFDVMSGGGAPELRSADLLAKAKSSRLNPSEVEEVLARVENADPRDDVYRLIYALGRGVSWSERADHAVARYVGSDDPMLTRVALQVLCTLWGRYEAYANELIAFARGGRSDDPEGDVLVYAAGVLGDLYARTSDDRVIDLLFDIAADDASKAIVRRSAVNSLAIAAGESVTVRTHDDEAQRLERDLATEIERWNR